VFIYANHGHVQTLSHDEATDFAPEPAARVASLPGLTGFKDGTGDTATLVDPGEDHLAELQKIIDAGLGQV
jgi:hypothetical protein